MLARTLPMLATVLSGMMPWRTMASYVTMNAEDALDLSSSTVQSSAGLIQICKFVFNIDDSIWNLGDVHFTAEYHVPEQGCSTQCTIGVLANHLQVSLKADEVRNQQDVATGCKYTYEDALTRFDLKWRPAPCRAVDILGQWASLVKWVAFHHKKGREFGQAAPKLDDAGHWTRMTDCSKKEAWPYMHSDGQVALHGRFLAPVEFTSDTELQKAFHAALKSVKAEYQVVRTATAGQRCAEHGKDALPCVPASKASFESVQGRPIPSEIPNEFHGKNIKIITLPVVPCPQPVSPDWEVTISISVRPTAGFDGAPVDPKNIPKGLSLARPLADASDWYIVDNENAGAPEVSDLAGNFKPLCICSVPA